MSRCLIALLTAAALVPSGTAVAAPAPTREAIATAKAHFEAGKRAFDEKRFEAAIGEFEQGQAAVPRPLFTFNIAQSYRRLAEAGDDGLKWTRRARDSYRLYIDTSNLNEPERVDALRHLLELEKKLEAPPGAAPPAAPPEDAPLAAQPLPEPAAEPVVVAAPPPQEEKSFGSKYGLWIGIGAGVAAAAGLAAGGYFAVQSTRCPASIGCVDARP